ncbi:glycoside hydrolase family 2 protein [Vallitalea guaymasensis]|uniref:glycoside hydrolase family 2 protein n=1 Tax=Vallitalea guaymasensis TaxID=1185412 RepID=UPI00272BD8C7|nr:sugar-binding domain-containing protein [Vallitalea guaymasensis]
MNPLRQEYPRPQMVRKQWQNLNGTWDFEYDFSKSGKERNLQKEPNFPHKIQVPFCPESELSGINYKDFLNAVWYRKTFTIPSDWKNGCLIINFEAVDYYCEVWVNGEYIGSHKGGYTPFSFDITSFVSDGENTLTVYAEDDTRTGTQPSGKQCSEYNSTGCFYTRVTGIWQTVWLEYVPKNYIKAFKIVPDVDNCKVHLDLSLSGKCSCKKLNVTAKYDNRIVGDASIKVTGSSAKLSIDLSELHLWQPLDAKLYDLELQLEGDNQLDTVNSYFGMRKVELGDKAILINGKKVFQRLVLDQGFYPDGIYTASSDEALKKDIELSIAFGFNGARLHEKVFERRFLYWADKMGYLVWGEYGNWGIDHTKASSLHTYLPEWIEAVERDYNSPALIGWCPFNETWDLHGHQQYDDILRNIYHVTKKMDSTRPVIDTSGNFHVVTDIYDLHNYKQDVELFAKDFEPMANGGEVFESFPDRQKYDGQPYFISEYGGIWWNSNDESGWGYGDRPESIEEFVNRYVGLTEVLIKNPSICALCYTQLYDVEQEQNGLYFYDRTNKFDDEVMAKLRAVMEQKAAIED